MKTDKPKNPPILKYIWITIISLFLFIGFLASVEYFNTGVIIWENYDSFRILFLIIVIMELSYLI